MMGTAQLRVLIVEDSEDDAELILADHQMPHFSSLDALATVGGPPSNRSKRGLLGSMTGSRCRQPVL